MNNKSSRSFYYDKDGRPVIIITGEKPSPAPDPKFKPDFPDNNIYNHFPEIRLLHDFDPKKISFISFYSCRKAQDDINHVLAQKRKNYVSDCLSVKNQAEKTLNFLQTWSHRQDPRIAPMIRNLRDSTNRLLPAIERVNQAENKVLGLQKETERGFNNFVAHKRVQMKNFKNKSPDLFDTALAINIHTLGRKYKQWVEAFWQEQYVVKLQAEVREKNNLLTLLEEAQELGSIVARQQKEVEKIKDYISQQAEMKKIEDATDIMMAVKFTTNFYWSLTEKYGYQQGRIAEELVAAAKGKRLKNAEQALAAYNKYKGDLYKKFGAKDREAVALALESLNRKIYADNLIKFSKGLGLTSKLIDRGEVVMEIIKALRTDNWEPVFIKLEKLAAGKVAASAVAFAFAVLTATPIGIIGYAFLMVLTSTLIDEDLMRRANKILFNI